MTWKPFGESNPPNPDAAAGAGGGEGKPPEKTPAEIIAESLSAGLKPVTDSLTAFNSRLDAIEANTKRPSKPPENVESISVLDDENAAFAQRMTPLMIRQLELESRVVKSDIKAEYAAAGYGDLWGQYETEINSVLDSSPLINGEGKTLRGDPQYVRNVVDMVMGRAARKAGMRFDGKSKGFFLETAGNTGGESRPPEADGLSDGQRRVFDRMKVPLADAKKVMAKLKFVNS